MTNNFGQLLAHKRKEARLSVPELSELSGVSQAHLEAIEEGVGELPTFDLCYKFGQVLTTRSGQLFVFQDLWIALRSDRLSRLNSGSAGSTGSSGSKRVAESTPAEERESSAGLVEVE